MLAQLKREWETKSLTGKEINKHPRQIIHSYVLFRWCSGSIPVMEQQQPFTIASLTLINWWIWWKILPRLHDISHFSNVHWKHMEGQQTALKTQQSQHVQTEIHALPASQISLLKKRGFLSQGGVWNEINIFPSAFSLVLFLLFHIIHAAVTRLFTQPIGDIYESSLMSSFGKSKYLWYNILSRKPLPNSIIGWKEDVKCPGHCCQTKWCLNNALWQETERNSVFWWLI